MGDATVPAGRWLYVAGAIIVALLAGACTGDRADPTYWQSDEFAANLPDDPSLAYPLHLRAAIRQEYGPGTWVDELSDATMIELLIPWCEAGVGRSSDPTRLEIERRGFDPDPGRNLLPPLPVDEIMIAIASRYPSEVCAVASGGEQ